ncbi:MAG: ribosomal large chain pseudouridine synthase [Chlamydiia bacterium]|nr:ribosomal large chain pseudouridine synthase [Chlamydiia bacterium]
MVTKRLSKALAAAGVASRRASEEIITDGRVTVNGKRVLVPQTLVDWKKDVITIDGVRLKGEESKVYYILNKPKGVLCTAAPIKGKRVIDLFEEDDGRLFTAGRLDKYTTGLLVVTNDGHFANRIIHPSSNIQKEYIAKVDKDVLDDHLKKISRGCTVEGTFVEPIQVQKVRKSTIKVVVAEGKKREVREMLTQAGLEVIELKRVRLGSLILGEIPEGFYRPMTEREKELIFE